MAHSFLNISSVSSGNNIYGEKIREVLSKNDGSRTQYVLMEKVRPPVLKNYIIQVHKEELLEEDVLCELGVFGVVIRYEKLKLIIVSLHLS